MQGDLFVVSSRHQTEWGTLVALSLFLLSVGAGLVFVSEFAAYVLGAAIGITIMVIGVISLLAHLNRRSRFWRAISNPASSWISRGVIFITITVIFGLLYLAQSYGLLSWFPLTAQIGLRNVSQTISMIGAILVMLYTGFELAANTSIPFWNTPLVPILSVLGGIMGGIGIIFISLAFGQVVRNIALVGLVQLVVIPSTIVAVISYLMVMSTSTSAARDSVQLLIKGRLSPILLIGVFTTLIISLILEAYVLYGFFTFPLIVLEAAGVLVVAGTFFLRLSIQMAGHYPSLV